MDILLQTIVLEFSKTKKHGGHLGFFTKISPKLQTVIKRLIMDGFRILRCLQKHIDILLQNLVFRIFKTQKTWRPSWIFHQHFTKITNSYKTANNGQISNFKVSTEAYGYSASNYCFIIFKNQKHGGHLRFF